MREIRNFGIECDNIGSANTMIYRFDANEKARKIIEKYKHEHLWVDGVMFFLNYTGAGDSDNQISRGFRYAALAVGHPTVEDCESAIRNAIKNELGIKLEDICVTDINTQSIFSAIQTIQPDESGQTQNS